MADDVVVVMGQTREFSPPVWRMMQLLTEERPRWLTLEAGEVAPEDLDPGRDSVCWTSLWTDRPRDRMLLEIFDEGLGSRVRWTLLSPDDDLPDEAQLRAMRHRVNELFNVLLHDHIETQTS